jgi:hypothetical protein
MTTQATKQTTETPSSYVCTGGYEQFVSAVTAELISSFVVV